MGALNCFEKLTSTKCKPCLLVCVDLPMYLCMFVFIYVYAYLFISIFVYVLMHLLIYVLLIYSFTYMFFNLFSYLCNFYLFLCHRFFCASCVKGEYMINMFSFFYEMLCLCICVLFYAFFFLCFMIFVIKCLMFM